MAKTCLCYNKNLAGIWYYRRDSEQAFSRNDKSGVMQWAGMNLPEVIMTRIPGEGAARVMEIGLLIWMK